MTLKKALIFVLIINSLFGACRAYAQSSNAGFVPGNIWYSLDPFLEGDKIKIYTLIFNPDPRELSGTVIFFRVRVENQGIYFYLISFEKWVQRIPDISGHKTGVGTLGICSISSKKIIYYQHKN